MRSVIISSSFLAALATALPAGGEPKERACSKYALNRYVILSQFKDTIRL